ncbi:ATP-binding protein [Lentzea sp. NPDC051838]|uniref:ATP-binding protein n=1 Tax=Lentzea sp. NPDC051838 TaxID=3154849 RepID=UPI00343DBA64
MLEARLDLGNDEIVLRAVREWISKTLEVLPPDLLDDVLLVANELVSNMIDHAEGPRSLSLRLRDGQLRVEATDGSPRATPIVGRSRLSESRGRGLIIVNACSTSWGVDLAHDHKTVWAEVPLGT